MKCTAKQSCRSLWYPSILRYFPHSNIKVLQIRWYVLFNCLNCLIEFLAKTKSLYTGKPGKSWKNQVFLGWWDRTQILGNPFCSDYLWIKVDEFLDLLGILLSEHSFLSKWRSEHWGNQDTPRGLGALQIQGSSIGPKQFTYVC